MTGYDLPSTLEHTKRAVERHGLGDRADYLAGDLREADPGTGRFEAAVLGHICHSEGPVHTPKLFEQMARALVPGGTLAIAEFVADEDRSGPLSVMLFSLNMLVNTTDGDTFTFAEYRDWLESAGFEDVRWLDAPAPSPLILATRR